MKNKKRNSVITLSCLGLLIMFSVLINPVIAFNIKAEEAITNNGIQAVQGENVTVKCVDESGNILTAVIILSGNIGDPYSSSAQEIAGYTLKNTPNNANGIYSDTPQNVTYVYSKIPIQGGDVTVKYVDESGNILIAVLTLSGNIGDPYSSSAQEIAGYTLKNTPNNANGMYSDAPQNVTYVYSKIPIQGENVTVKYVDDSGTSIAPDIILTGNIGETYRSSPEMVSGYALLRTATNASGTFSDEPQTVTYIYMKCCLNLPTQGKITIRYVDESDMSLIADITLNGNIGEHYTSDASIIPGYTLKSAPDNASGMYAEQDQTVTYVYSKISNNETPQTPEIPQNTEITKIKDVLPKTGGMMDLGVLILLGNMLIIGGALVIKKVS